MSKYIIDSSFDSGDYYMHPSKGLLKVVKDNKFLARRQGTKHPDPIYPLMNMKEYSLHLKRYKSIIDKAVRKYEKKGILDDVRGKISSLSYYHCHVKHMWMYPGYVMNYITYIDIENHKGNIDSEEVKKKACIKLKTASFEIYRILKDIKACC